MFFKIDDFSSFKPEKALSILCRYLNNQPEREAFQLLNKPKPNQAFLYFCQFLNDDLFIANGYRWRNVGSTSSKCGMKTQRYYIATPPKSDEPSKKAGHSSEFRKFVYSFIENGFKIGCLVLIWYSHSD